ncbi:MAG: hypothetical protein B6229_09725 [Spirochaetaceae bacterium 4572_7]|nr:MAG: hypothetical protein B6229_09725 [Spirochaetaceae bacterium 4572_7]
MDDKIVEEAYAKFKKSDKYKEIMDSHSSNSEADILYRQGFEQGFKEGFIKGEHLRAIKTVKIAKNNNIPIDLIVDMTGLGKEDIEKL